MPINVVFKSSSTEVGVEARTSCLAYLEPCLIVRENCDGATDLEGGTKVFVGNALRGKAVAPNPIDVLPLEDKRNDRENWRSTIATKKGRTSSRDIDKHDVVLEVIAGIALKVKSAGWHANEL